MERIVVSLVSDHGANLHLNFGKKSGIIREKRYGQLMGMVKSSRRSGNLATQLPSVLSA